MSISSKVQGRVWLVPGRKSRGGADRARSNTGCYPRFRSSILLCSPKRAAGTGRASFAEFLMILPRPGGRIPAVRDRGAQDARRRQEGDHAKEGEDQGLAPRPDQRQHDGDQPEAERRDLRKREDV